MYGMISGISDTDDINFCPKCGQMIQRQEVPRRRTRALYVLTAERRLREPLSASVNIVTA